MMWRPRATSSLPTSVAGKRPRRYYDPFEIRLYGVHEAAEYLGISKKNLEKLERRGLMVAPVVRLRCGRIWSESQLDEQLFAWRDNPPVMLSPAEVEELTLKRRLTTLDRRWAGLVEIVYRTVSVRTTVRAIWRGEQRALRGGLGRRAVLSPRDARRALAEAKLLRMVSDLADQDNVFRGIADELDEAVDLRQRLDALRDPFARHQTKDFRYRI